MTNKQPNEVVQWTPDDEGRGSTTSITIHKKVTVTLTNSPSISTLHDHTICPWIINIEPKPQPTRDVLLEIPMNPFPRPVLPQPIDHFILHPTTTTSATLWSSTIQNPLERPPFHSMSGHGALVQLGLIPEHFRIGHYLTGKLVNDNSYDDDDQQQ